MTDKCAFCNNTVLPKEEVNNKIYGKPVCNSKDCITKANAELQAATDAAMSPRDKVISYLAREGFKEQGMAKGLFIQDGSNIAVDLRELPPKIGVLIGSEIQEEGHGVSRVSDVRNTIETMLKSKPAQKAKETPAKAEKKAPPKCPICNKDMILAVVDVVDGGEDVGGVPIEGFACEDEAKHIAESKKTQSSGKYNREIKPEPKPQPKPAEVVKPKGDEKMETRREDKALAIKEPEVTLSIDVIKQYICPTATDAEAFNFLQLCHYRQLNPFLKEAYLIKYGAGAASMVVGKDAFTRKAEESQAFDGYEAGIVLISGGNFEERVGTILKPKEELIGGWAKVYRKNTAKPFEVRVSLAEYDKKLDNGKKNNWNTMPATMIRKVALVQALREAFTKELGGCYDATETDPDAVIVEEKK